MKDAQSLSSYWEPSLSEVQNHLDGYNTLLSRRALSAESTPSNLNLRDGIIASDFSL